MGLSYSRLLIPSAALVGMSLGGFADAAAEVTVVDIVQKHRAFAVSEVTIERQGSLRFINADDFPHQVHATGPGVDVDSPLQPAGATLVVAFPVEGTFQVTCGVHPRMHMTVTVK